MTMRIFFRLKPGRELVKSCLLSLFGLLLLFEGTLAQADDEETIPTLPDADRILTRAVGNAIVTAIGIGTHHRPYEPATPLGTAVGFNFGIETTLTQPPTTLGTALGGLAGITGGSTDPITVPIVPALKVHGHKGFGQYVDFGISFIPNIPTVPILMSSYFFGADLKVVVKNDEEGVTWAARVTYGLSAIGYSQQSQTIKIGTNTFGFQVLVSRRMDFADPYIGAGVEYTLGNLSVTNPVARFIGPESFKQTGSGYGAEVFGGVCLHVPYGGLDITLEGGYSPFGMNYLGTKIGFGF